jgi:hypothetical protein
MMSTIGSNNSTAEAHLLGTGGVELESQSLAIEGNLEETVHLQPQDPDMSEWNEQLRRLQRASIWLSHVLALLAVSVVVWWIYLLGGLSWKFGQAKLVFNWHPLCMTTAFCFMTVASLTFRFQGTWPRYQVKLLHGMAWTVAVLCALVALVAVLQSHNDGVSGYIANLYSLHSWIGCAIILIYLIQFIAGVVTFWWPLSWMTPLFKAQVMSIHTFVGTYLYTATAATILLGIQEKEGFVGCAYKVAERPDLFPLQNFSQIPLPCRVSHLLGIVVFAMTVSTSFALHNLGGQPRRGTAKIS